MHRLASPLEGQTLRCMSWMTKVDHQELSFTHELSPPWCLAREVFGMLKHQPAVNMMQLWVLGRVVGHRRK